MIAHMISAVLLEIAYLATGIALSLIGKDLLEKGITGKFTADGEVASRKLRIATSSPGLVFLLAGLAIVVTAVIQKAEFQETIYPRAQSAAPATASEDPARKDPAAPDSVLQRLVSSRFAVQPEHHKMATRLYEAAQAELADRNPLQAREYLVGAVGLSPGLFQQAQADPGMKELTADAAFTEFSRLRLRIALAAQREQPLSADAKLVLQQLKIYALSKPPSKDTAEVRRLVSGIPKESGAESPAETIRRLQALLRTDPRMLSHLLGNPQYRWITQERDVFRWLQQGGERFFTNLE